MHKKEQHDEHSHKHNLFLFTQTQTKLSAANTTTTAAPTTNTTTEAVPTADQMCIASPAMCEIKSSAGEVCYVKWTEMINLAGDDMNPTKFCTDFGRRECIDGLVKANFTFPLATGGELLDASGKAYSLQIAGLCSGDIDTLCMAYPATCEVKDSAGTFCVTKFMQYSESLQQTSSDARPSCENVEEAGVSKECVALLVESKLDFKSVEGESMMEQEDVDPILPVLSACATGAPIPDDGPDDKLTPIDASVVLAGMTKDEFDAGNFASATAKTMDISERYITGVKAEVVAASSKRRSLTATNLKVTFKVAVKDTMEAKEVSDKLTEAAKDGSFKANLEATGITGFTGIEEPTVAIDQAPAEATPAPAAPTTTTTKAPTTTTTKAPTTTTTKAPVQTATTKAPVKTLTTKGPVKTVTTAPTKTSGAYVPSFFVGVAGLAFAAMSA